MTTPLSAYSIDPTTTDTDSNRAMLSPPMHDCRRTTRSEKVSSGRHKSSTFRLSHTSTGRMPVKNSARPTVPSAASTSGSGVLEHGVAVWTAKRARVLEQLVEHELLLAGAAALRGML